MCDYVFGNNKINTRTADAEPPFCRVFCPPVRKVPLPYRIPRSSPKEGQCLPAMWPSPEQEVGLTVSPLWRLSQDAISQPTRPSGVEVGAIQLLSTLSAPSNGIACFGEMNSSGGENPRGFPLLCPVKGFFFSGNAARSSRLCGT